MRLIDEDDLVIGKANPEAFIKPEYAYGWNAAIEAIKEAPTIDAVPVDKISFTDLYLANGEAIATFKFGNRGITLRKKYEDFVHVVRCKDCLWRKEYNAEGDCWCMNPSMDCSNLLPPDAFCSYGEREGEA